MGKGEDFALRSETATYYFIHKLAIVGHADVTTGVGGVGARAFSQVKEHILDLCWVDNSEKLAWAQNLEAGLLSFDATVYPYGSNMVVRLARGKCS